MRHSLFSAVLAASILAIAPVNAAPWPKGDSDLTLDAGTVFGTLPNGMHYAVRHNANPSNGVSIRLRIEAGGVDEPQGQSGEAHLLEHMVFRGSAHLADGQAMQTLQDLGASPGVDANAETRASDTVFKLDIPLVAADSLTRALNVLREMTGEAVLADTALASEKRVVIAERRLRMTPGAEVTQRSAQFILGGAAADAMMPIGTENSINNITTDQLRAFYQANYRPDRATLIIVGDVDPEATVQAITQVFANWHPVGAAGPQPSVPLATHKPEDVASYVASGANNTVTIAWAGPFDSGLDTNAVERRDSLRLVSLALLNTRLAERAQSSDAPFVAAGFVYDNQWNIALLTQISLIYAAGGRDKAVSAAEQIRQDVLHGSILADELARAVASARALLLRVSDQQTRGTSSQVADGLVSDFSSHEVPTSQETALQIFDTATKGMTAATIQHTLAGLFDNTGPIVFAAGAKTEGDENTLRKALQVSASTQAKTPATATPQGDLAPAAITPGSVSKLEHNAALDLTIAHFGNGVVLTVKPNHAIPNQVMIDVGMGDGRIGGPADHNADWSFSGFMAGGLGTLSVVDLNRRLAGRAIQALPLVDDRAFHIQVKAAKADLQVLLTILAAYQGDPGFRAEGLAQAKAIYEQVRTTINGSPVQVAAANLPTDIRGGDRRWALASPEAVASLNAADWKASLEPRLQSRPADIVVAGDVDPDAVVKAVAATFGTLPSFKGTVVTDGHEQAPAPQLADTGALTGESGQVSPVVAWPTKGYGPDEHTARTLSVLGNVFERRLFDDLRTHQGISYAPQVRWLGSHATPDFGSFVVIAQTPAEKVSAFYETALRIAADLATTPVTQEELARSVGPIIADIRKDQGTNEYWISHLRDSARDPLILKMASDLEKDYQSVTAADLQKVAQRVLQPEKAWEHVYTRP